MPDPADEIRRLLDLLRRGDGQAAGLLVTLVYERYRRLTSQMLRGYPALRRWEQTDDVWQTAVIRLLQALETTQPVSPLHLHFLASRHIRFALIDLVRHNLGPQGHGRNHHTDGAGKAADDKGGPLDARPSAADEHASLEEWSAFHQRVDTLPQGEREVVDLLWYEGLTQQEAARTLGVSLRTVKRLWQSARLELDGGFGAPGEAP